MNQTAPVNGQIAEQKKNAINLLKMSRMNTLGILKKIPEEHMLLRPVPGGNHALWIIGHLANVDDETLMLLSGDAPRLDSTWKENFATGSTVRDGADGYPAPAELRKVFSSLRKDFSRWFDSLDEQQLLTTLPGRFEGVGDHLAMCGFMAWHESYHCGQLSVVRKALSTM